MFWYVTDATVVPSSCWSLCTTNRHLGEIALQFDLFDATDTYTRHPDVIAFAQAEHVGEHRRVGTVDPATSRRSVT